MRLGIRSLQRPPPAVWLAAIGLLIGMPLIDSISMDMANWSMGGSPAMALLAPYFTALCLLHAVTALSLALLLLSGMAMMAVSGGQASWPVGQGVLVSCFGPAFVTLYLLRLSSIRRFYGIGRSAVDARAPDA